MSNHVYHVFSFVMTYLRLKICSNFKTHERSLREILFVIVQNANLLVVHVVKCSNNVVVVGGRSILVHTVVRVAMQVTVKASNFTNDQRMYCLY